jgi:hypothetical protein
MGDHAVYLTIPLSLWSPLGWSSAFIVAQYSS